MQLLFVSDQATNDLPKSIGKSTDDLLADKQFSHLLADRVMTKKQLLADEALPMLVQKISDELQLSEEDYEELLELVRTLLAEEQIVDLTDTALLQQLIGSLNELLHGNQENSTNELVQILKSHLSQIKNSDQLMQLLANNHQIESFFQLKIGNDQMLDNGLQKDHQHLFQQFVSLMESIESEEDLLRQTPVILKLLEQWSQQGDKMQLQMTEQTTAKNKQLFQLWDKLVNRYTKRTQLSNQTPYSNESKVTTRDIANWMKHLAPALETNEQLNRNTPMFTSNSLTGSPMSPIEQYVIYMQHSDDEQVTSEQLLKQFRQIIQTSQFSPTHPMFNQLAITLKPDNLGEMLVRFVEINGEMTVKILVSSQATKSLLETNVHQLKHMFAPHQISIEKTADNEQLLAEDESFKEDADTHDEQKEQQEKQHEQASDRDRSDFHKILNEFV